MCTIDFDGSCSVWRTAARVARKPHVCAACGTTIRPGDPYMSTFMVYDGDATADAGCWRCWFVQTMFSDEHGVYFQPRSLIQLLNDCAEDGTEDSKRWRKWLRWILIRAARPSTPEKQPSDKRNG